MSDPMKDLTQADQELEDADRRREEGVEGDDPGGAHAGRARPVVPHARARRRSRTIPIDGRRRTWSR